MKLRHLIAAVASSALLVGGTAAVANGRAGSTLTAGPESHYVPITPCRIVDTRAGTGTGATPLAPLQVRTYYVGGTLGFGPQGGLSGGCGIPIGATAIAATLLVVSPSHAGRLQAWPNGQSEPTATTFYYVATTSSSGNTLTINAAAAYSLKVRNYSSTTDLVIDVTGYYIAVA